MLRFAVFDHDAPASRWTLRHAHLVGPDDVPMPAEIRFEDGHICCEKRGTESAALSLQFPIDGSDLAEMDHAGGLITLQTCLLPERKRPYLLSLELARHRIMLFLNKLEDWALFDLPPADRAMVTFERARAAFTDAVVATHRADDENLSAADSAARIALALAIEASETLAIEHARHQYRRRASGEIVRAAQSVATPENAITDHETRESRNALIGTVGVILPTPLQIGVCIAPSQYSASLQRVVQESCDFIRMPMRWIGMEPNEGKYSFGETDRWIEWAVRRAKLPIVGGPVIDFRPEAVPEWLYIWEHDYETLRELVYEHVRQIVTRYRRTVGTWTVASGLNVNRNFSFSFEQILDLTRLCITVVRKLQPSAKIQIEIDHPWGEFVTETPRSIPPTMYAEMITQAGLSVDTFGLRVEMGQPETGRSTRDMMAYSAMLDRFAALEMPIALTALSTPSEPPEPESLGLGGQLDPGSWRGPWDSHVQRCWMTQALGIAASKPYVHSACWSDLYDPVKPAHNRYTGLIDTEGQPKPVLERLREIRLAVHEHREVLDLESSLAAASQ